MTQICARCHRPTATVVIVGKSGYGPRCAVLVGGEDLLTPKRQPIFTRMRIRKKDERQTAMFEVSA